MIARLRLVVIYDNFLSAAVRNDLCLDSSVLHIFADLQTVIADSDDLIECDCLAYFLASPSETLYCFPPVAITAYMEHTSFS